MQQPRALRDTRRFARRTACACLLLAGFAGLAPAQTPGVQRPPTPGTLADFVRELPEIAFARDSKEGQDFLAAVESATEAERLAIVPPLLRWAADPRPEVREEALGLVGVIYYAFQPASGSAQRPSLPVLDVARVAAHLLDPVGTVRPKAVLALLSATYTPDGDAELTRVLLPLLRDPGVLTRFPDPFFIRGNAFILSKTPPERQEAVRRMQQQQRVILLPAVGSGIFGLLVSSRFPTTPATDDALVVFLQRPDQTADTLSDCLHDLALNHASERVNDEALTRVFDKGAMSVFLIQFLNRLQLTPEHLSQQKTRLLTLAQDPAAAASLRHAAETVAACWGGDPHAPCAPSAEDFRQAKNPPHPAR